jgi:hypothetical protein
MAVDVKTEVFWHDTPFYLLDSLQNIGYVCCRSGRFASEPTGGLTSLKGEPPGPGFGVRSDL